MTSGKREQFSLAEILELDMKSYRSYRSAWKKDSLGRIDYHPEFPSNARTFSQPIRPPPENILLQFIGGPFNAEQRYLSWKRYNTFEGRIVNFALFEGIPTISSPEDMKHMQCTAETYGYRFTFVPMSQTPFSDAQICYWDIPRINNP